MFQYGKEMNETHVLQTTVWAIPQWRRAANTFQQCKHKGQAERNFRLAWKVDTRTEANHSQTVALFFMEAAATCLAEILKWLFLCRRISSCVYYCFDVHHKFLPKGHKIVMTHHKPGCNNMLTVEENCVKTWRIINIKASVWIKKKPD